MDDQMKMFEEGGLYQEGGTTDPVSGNEVPTGSLQEEVRDDIDAKLSEGEFVFPADVVRYIGLENLMQLRQKAKEGLGKMEDMGQMGNSEEAIMDDDLEYNADIDSLIDEFDPDEPDSMEFAVGGAVPGLNIPSFNPQSYMSSSGSLPSYSQFMGGSSVPQYSSKQYIGPNGDIITITFLNGNPVQQIPEGYKLFTGQVVAPKVEAPEVKAPQDRGDGGKTREEEKEEEQRQADFKMTADVLSRNNPAFAEKWAADPFNTGKFTGWTDAFKSIDTALSMTDAIEQIAKEQDIDLDLYENTGLSRLGGKYDSVSFAKSLALDEEDAHRGKLSEGLKEEQERKANEKRAATRAGMTARAGVVPSTSAQRRGVDTTREMSQTVRQQELANRESTEAAGGRAEWAGSDYDGDGKDDERDNEVSGFDDPTSESYGELAKGGLLAPRTPRKPKAKQTTSTRGKGLARKK